MNPNYLVEKAIEKVAKKMAKQEKIPYGTESIREFIEEKKMEKIGEEKAYKNPVLFLRKSKAGKHLYAFNYEGALGGDVGSLIMDVSEIERLLEGSTAWIKIGVIPVDTAGATEGD